MKRQFKIPNSIVVLGGNHHNGLGIIRSLGEIGCKLFFIAISTRKSYVTKSKYIEKSWYAESEQDVLNIIFDNFSQENTKSIIIPSDDYTASIVDRNLNLLSKEFLVPNINWEENAVLKNMNKHLMNSLAEKHGLLVPKSYEINLNEVEGLTNNISRLDINYPCIVKPLQSIDGSKSDIIINRNPTDLQKTLEGLKDIYKEVIIQEFINIEREFGIQGIVTCGGKEIIIPGIIEKLRQSTAAPGSTTYAKLVKTNVLIEMDKVKSFIKGLGYAGIFDMELMYSKGKVYFIELNFRNGAYGYAYTKAGINLPALWCLNAIGQDISFDSKLIKREVTLMSEIADFRNVFDSKLRLVKWIVQFLKSDVHLILNKHDLRPFIYKFIYR